MRRKAVVLVVVAVIGAGIFAALSVPYVRSAQPELRGTILTNTSVPAGRLHDQFGSLVSLSQFRGQPEVVTFLESHCKESCPLVAETIRRVTDSVARAGVRIPVLIVSTDPERDRPAPVKAFLRAHQLSNGWRYLTGTRSQLVPFWSAFGVFVPPALAPGSVRDGHTSATFVVDRNKRPRVLLTAVPDARILLRDLRILSGLPLEDQKGANRVVPSVGQPAPQVVLQSLDAGTSQLRSLRGKVVLLNFWATWCPPCRSEMPLLSRIARDHHRDGLRVIGVDRLEDSGTVRSFVKAVRVPYPIALDPAGALWGRFQPIAVPETFLIDRAGTIRAIRTGAVNERWIRGSVLPLLGSQS